MSNQIRKKVKIVLAGFPKARNPICEEDDCPLWKRCANHSSAGDFREESGFTPSLLREHDGSWTCDQLDSEETFGMLVWDEKQNKYAPYEGL